jgi:hypothetical protein
MTTKEKKEKLREKTIKINNSSSILVFGRSLLNLFDMMKVGEKARLVLINQREFVLIRKK